MRAWFDKATGTMGALAVVLAAAGVVAACGGGGGASGGAATAFSEGAITGFGSVIVNGVRFDDSSARVSDDDGAAHDRGELRLGMRVQVLSDSIQAGAAHATEVHFGSELVGAVTTVDTTARTIAMLDQVVDVSANTVFDDRIAGGLAGVQVGAVLEVHAVFDAGSGHYSATRIEPKAGATQFKLRGTVSALDTQAKTFHIGGALVSYAGIAAGELPGGLADGLKLRATLQPVKQAGAWVATRLRSADRRMEDHDEAHVRGRITAFTSATAFTVNDVPVDAAAASFPDGQAGLALGVAVQVEGALRNGVLVATKVELESQHAGDDDRLTELHGSITATDTAANTIVVRGVTVSVAGNVVFQRGSAANLVVGAKVEVKGSLSADGATVQAANIKFED